MRVKYSLAKIVVILITILWFLYDYKDFSSALKEEKVASILILIFTALLVHVLKAGRLYLALYGTRRKLRTYLKKYCIVTPVTIILPFKIGELFRMHYYGSQIGNVLKGIVIIFLDRFMDTLALVTTILFNGLVYFVTMAGEGMGKTMIDDAEYFLWLNEYLDDAQELVLPYKKLTEENIAELLKQ